MKSTSFLRNVDSCVRKMWSVAKIMSSEMWDSLRKCITLNWKLKISKIYRDIANAFNDQKADSLSSHRDENLSIELEESETSSFESLYKLFNKKMKILREYLNTHLRTDFIRLLKSFAKTSVLFALKKNESLRLCVNYRDLNRKTIKNRYLLLLIENLLH